MLKCIVIYGNPGVSRALTLARAEGGWAWLCGSHLGVFRLTCGPLPRGRGGLRLGRALKDTSGMGRPEEVRLVMGTTRKGFVGPLVGRIAIKSGTSVTVLMWV